MDSARKFGTQHDDDDDKTPPLEQTHPSLAWPAAPQSSKVPLFYKEADDDDTDDASEISIREEDVECVNNTTNGLLLRVPSAVQMTRNDTMTTTTSRRSRDCIVSSTSLEVEDVMADRPKSLTTTTTTQSDAIHTLRADRPKSPPPPTTTTQSDAIHTLRAAPQLMRASSSSTPLAAAVAVNVEAWAACDPLNNNHAFNEEEEEEAYLEGIFQRLKEMIIEARADARRASSNHGYHKPRHPAVYDEHPANSLPTLHDAWRSELSQHHHHHHHHHHYYYNRRPILELTEYLRELEKTRLHSTTLHFCNTCESNRPCLLSTTHHPGPHAVPEPFSNDGYDPNASNTANLDEHWFSSPSSESVPRFQQYPESVAAPVAAVHGTHHHQPLITMESAEHDCQRRYSAELDSSSYERHGGRVEKQLLQQRDNMPQPPSTRSSVLSHQPRWQRTNTGRCGDPPAMMMCHQKIPTNVRPDPPVTPVQDPSVSSWPDNDDAATGSDIPMPVASLENRTAAAKSGNVNSLTNDLLDHHETAAHNGVSNLRGIQDDKVPQHEPPDNHFYYMIDNPRTATTLIDKTPTATARMVHDAGANKDVRSFSAEMAPKNFLQKGLAAAFCTSSSSSPVTMIPGADHVSALFQAKNNNNNEVSAVVVPVKDHEMETTMTSFLPPQWKANLDEKVVIHQHYWQNDEPPPKGQRKSGFGNTDRPVSMSFPGPNVATAAAAVLQRQERRKIRNLLHKHAIII